MCHRLAEGYCTQRLEPTEQSGNGVLLSRSQRPTDKGHCRNKKHFATSQMITCLFMVVEVGVWVSKGKPHLTSKSFQKAYLGRPPTFGTPSAERNPLFPMLSSTLKDSFVCPVTRMQSALPCVICCIPSCFSPTSIISVLFREISPFQNFRFNTREEIPHVLFTSLSPPEFWNGVLASQFTFDLEKVPSRWYPH